MVLNGQHSSWRDVNAGVPQGSILRPLLFLVYINDLTNGLKSNLKLFADDASLFSVIFFSYLGFLSRTFTIHRTAGKKGRLFL